MSASCVDRCLREFHYTIKSVDIIPAAHNCTSAIEQCFDYAQKYRQLEQEYLAEAFIFADEVGFKVSTRPKKGRSCSGTRATTPVPFGRSCNISIDAVINKEGMIYFKIHNQAVTAADFQVCLEEIKIKCNSKGINNPVLVLDNAKIHHVRNLVWDGFMVFYLPPYCPFLYLIENSISISFRKTLLLDGHALLKHN